MKRFYLILLALVAVGLLGAAGVAAYGYYLVDDHQVLAEQPKSANGSNGANGVNSAETADLVARGEYLVRAGNCMSCHTARGGAAFAGGRVLQTEFGDFVAPNITPDVKTGIGGWSAEDFWQALHNGKGRGGRMLYPAFPYTNYSQVTRTDSDAMYAYFQSIPKIERPNQPHELRFPYDQRALLAFWRAAYFRPSVYRQDTQQSAEWNRGAYLVNGLGHCSACHSSRNMLGANAGTADLSGGELALTSWYAPSLANGKEINLAQWQAPQLLALLKHGINADTAVSGPMAEVVSASLQHLSEQDMNAMVTYLRATPAVKVEEKDLLDRALSAQNISKETMDGVMKSGAALYKTHCMDCHGAAGAGVPSIYPALKGNPAIQTQLVANPVRLILAGGFPPVTKGNPRPYGMPPFGQVLSDNEVALVLSYVRNAWGNQASVVTAPEVNRYRTATLD
ncbi:c-type cytochrome [Undibacterium sp. Ji49W]|uniref:c-type cytochrome n=1 Tax=Undibacterium sp. Ji49W TaxID=3413040 RepID=UPI003BEFA96F